MSAHVGYALSNIIHRHIKRLPFASQEFFPTQLLVRVPLVLLLHTFAPLTWKLLCSHNTNVVIVVYRTKRYVGL